MIIVCKMSQCPYYSGGWCAKPDVVTIDERGMCSVLWKKGQPKLLKTPFTDEYYPKVKATIIEADV